jgi:hypothetical protein
LGHIGIDGLIKLVENKSIDNLHPDLTVAAIRRHFPQKCKQCGLGSMAQKPISKNRQHHKLIPTEVGAIVEVDVMYGTKNGIGSELFGETFSGFKYLLVSVDHASRFVVGVLLKSLDGPELANGLKSIINRYSSDGHKIKHFKFDDQFDIRDIHTLLCSYQPEAPITFETCPPHEHSLLGLVERTNRTIEESIIKAMSGPNISDKRLWGLAAEDSILKINLKPKYILNWKTPYELYFKVKFDLKRHPLIPFGSKVLAHIPSKDQSTFHTKSIETLAVGTADNTDDAIKLWNPITKKIITRRTYKEYEEPLNPIFDTDIEINHSNKSEEISNHNPSVDPSITTPFRSIIRTRSMMNNDARTANLATSDNITSLNKIDSIDIPKSIAEAEASIHSASWMNALKSEIESLVNQGTWTTEFIGHLTPRHQTIPSMFVFDVRYNPDGTIKKFKCRLVARGDWQTDSTYKETFADTIASKSVNIILSLAAQHDLELESIDVKTAFLYSFIKEDIYLRRPKGITDDIMPPIVKLNKCIYGLKQAAYEWKNNIHQTLISMGFTQLLTDNCVYIKRSGNDLTILGIHVDDILIACSNSRLKQEFNDQLSKYYEISINDPLDSYLGMDIKRNRENQTITISQPGYINRILDRFNVQDSPVNTPMKVERNSNDIDIKHLHVPLTALETTLYQSKVGAVNYLAVKTRPDLSYAISRCSNNLQNPNQLDMINIDHILKYIKNTKDFGITYKACTDNKLYGYIDASYANHEDRKSHYGISLHLGNENGSFHTVSKKMKLVALSSTEAEYIALCEGTKLISWTRQFLSELGFTQTSPTVIYEDNISAIHMVNNGNDHGRTKHIDIRYHYVRQMLLEKQIILEHLSTHHMHADMLTKALSFNKFREFRGKILGSHNLQNSGTVLLCWKL